MAAQKDADEPFFAYYPMVLIHSPWPQTPDNIDVPQKGWTPEDNLRIPETQKWSQPNFNAMIEYTDKLIGRVVKSIDDIGIAENTLLIVTADNGTISKVTSQYQGREVRGGKMRATEQGARVPFLVYWKGTVEAGSVNDNLIDFTDILPTLVELGGGELPADRVLDGQSFLGQLRGEKNAPARESVFIGYGTNAIARSNTRVLNLKGDLFDVSKDRYSPTLIQPQAYTDQDELTHKKLTAAMKALDHPYTGAKRGKGQRATKRNKKAE